MKLFLDLHEKHSAGLLASAVRLEDVVHTVELLVADLPPCAALLEAAPVYKRQQESWDKVLKIISHLLHLVTQLPQEKIADLPFRRYIAVTIEFYNFFLNVF